MSSGKTQREILDSLLSNATTNTSLAVMDIKDTMVQNLKNGTGLGKVPTINELTAAKKRRLEKSSKKSLLKKEKRTSSWLEITGREDRVERRRPKIRPPDTAPLDVKCAYWYASTRGLDGLSSDDDDAALYRSNCPSAGTREPPAGWGTVPGHYHTTPAYEAYWEANAAAAAAEVARQAAQEAQWAAQAAERDRIRREAERVRNEAAAAALAADVAAAAAVVIDKNKTRAGTNWCTQLPGPRSRCDNYVQWSGFASGVAALADAGGGSYLNPNTGRNQGYEEGAICTEWFSADESDDEYGACKPSSEIIAANKTTGDGSAFITRMSNNVAGRVAVAAARDAAKAAEAAAKVRPPDTAPMTTKCAFWRRSCNGVDTSSDEEDCERFSANCEEDGTPTPPTPSAAGKAAKIWAQNRIRDAVVPGCSVATGGTKACPAEKGVTACDSLKDMFDDMENPILRNIVMDTGSEPGGEPPDLQLKTENGTVNPRGIGWLRIPTSTANNLGAEWGNGGASVDKIKYEPTVNHSLSYITMLIAKKYNAAESKEIFDVLTAGEGSIYAPKLSNGTGFIFTKEGHIRIWNPATGSTQNDIMYNPFINMAAPSGTTDASGNKTSVTDRLSFDSQTDETNTMAAPAGDQGVGRYSTGDRGIGGPLFAMSSKVVMNKALTYILYTPDIVPSVTSIYYLLYNPIHGREFKRFYQSILQSGNSTTVAEPLYTANVSGGAYPVANVRVYDRAECRQAFQVPSYNKIIAKYCNAFKMPGHEVRGSTLTHYADPLCPIMMGKMSSIFNYALGHNITHESLRRKYYKRARTETSEDGHAQFSSAQNQFSGGQHHATSMSWACKQHSVSGVTANLQDYMEDIGMYGENNTSFIQIMGHALVNNSVEWRSEDTNNWASIQRVGTIADEIADPLKHPTCRVADKSFTSCTNTINIAGDATNSNLGQSSVCGPQPAHIEVPDADAVKAAADAACELDQSACPPDLEACETAEGSTSYQHGPSGAITRYSKCCYGKQTGEIIGVYPCTELSGGDGATLENGGLTETSDSRAATLAIMVSGLMDKIVTAGKVGTTAKTAYPTDLVIGAAAEEIASKLAAGVALGEGLSPRINPGITVATTTAEINLIAADADKLAIISADLKKLGDDLVILIATTYMFGIKKMYLIGGAIGLVVLILLIVLLKK